MDQVCGRCGGSNRRGARFCADCGDHLRPRCVACDTELTAAGRFCDSCGAPVAAAEQARKIVTVVFADLVGSTAVQERMDPESVRALNARCYSAMREVIERHGGRVVKFVGDGMMAAFGVPTVREDDAHRALRAASELHAALADVVLRVGVNTGEVVVDEGDVDVVGDAVNVAARLEAAAPPGGVLVGEQTYRLTRGDAAFDAPRSLPVKGRAEAVTARLLVSPARGGSDEVVAPFVGREAELARLVEALELASTTSTGRLVTVLGSPGVGKSRLLAELQATAAPTTTVLVGRCDPANSSTFAAVAGVVRGAIDVAGAVDDGVASAVAFLVGDAEPGPPERTFWGVRRVIEAAARFRPVLIVLDDLHWAEPVLLDLLDHLAEWLRASPVLLVAAARPELVEQRPALVEMGARRAAVLALEGLDVSATRRLADALLRSGELPPEVAGRVVTASEGNPLFVRELVRMLIDDGVLRADADGWSSTVDAADIDVPPTIMALLAERIERLQADERTVLERASVVGHDVLRGALAHLLPSERRAQLDDVLDSLRRKELLEPAGTYWIDEPVLRFHHALIRDAAYRRLLRQARADLHERVGAWLVDKTGGGPDHDELIGHHLEQAQANLRQLGDLDDHARSVASEAGRRLGDAASRALHRDDLGAAAALAGRAQACTEPDDPARAELLLVSCEALLGTGDIAAVRPLVEELGRRAVGDDRLQGWATAFTVQLATLTGTADLVAADALAHHAAELLVELGDPTGAAKAHRVRASVLARLGRVADAETALDEALIAAREAGDHRQISGVLAAAPPAALWGPSPVPRAGGRCLDVVRLLRITTGARDVEAVSMWCQAVLEALRGRHRAARRMLAAARRTIEDLGLRHRLHELELAAGLVELTAGRATAAEEHLRAAHEGFTELGLEADGALAAALLARAALALDDLDRASTLADTVAALGDRDLKTAIAWRSVKAEVLARAGAHAHALELARAAVALAEPTDALIDHADALATLAAVSRMAGDHTGAAQADACARARYEQKGATALAERLGPPALPERPDAPGRPATTDVSSEHVSAIAREAEPLIVRVEAEMSAHMLGRRWEAYRSLLHPDCTFDDRRPGLQGRIVGRDAAVASVRAAVGLGVSTVSNTLVTLVSENLGLFRSHVSGRADRRVDDLFVVECDDDGLVVRNVQLDPDHVDAARAELEGLATAPVDNLAARAVRVTDRLVLDGDWEAYRKRLHPVFLYVDRRPGLTTRPLRRDDSVANTRAGVELGVTSIDHEVVATSGDLTALLRTAVATESFVVESLLLTTCDEDGRSTGCVNFEPAQIDEALSELDGLRLENTATRVQRATTEMLLAGDVDGLLASTTATFVSEDRRQGQRMVFDRQTYVENMRAILALGVDQVENETIAVAGDRAVLTRVDFGSHASGYSAVLLAVVTVDRDGLLAGVVGFDVDSIDDAFAALHRAAESTARLPAPTRGGMRRRP